MVVCQCVCPKVDRTLLQTHGLLTTSDREYIFATIPDCSNLTNFINDRIIEPDTSNYCTLHYIDDTKYDDNSYALFDHLCMI